MTRPGYIILLILSIAVFLSGCQNPFVKKTNWRVSLDKKDKKPYGGFLAFESLKLAYPEAEIHPLSPGFRYSNMDEGMLNGAGALFVAVGLDFYLTDYELDRLVEFAEAGNEVVIFSRGLDEKLEDYLGCTISNSGFEEMPLTNVNTGKASLNSISVSTKPEEQFGYQGKPVLGFFKLKNVKEEDTVMMESVRSLPDTLGHVKTQPNFIRYAVGDGHITLHAAPLVMSNYFLLQPGNEKYLEGIWQSLPIIPTRIYWNDYFKRSTKASDLGVLLKYPGTRWAFFLAIFGLLVYVIFESKRKQRIIPEVKPLENSSVSFVETVGRLYYNKGDHNNIAEKMVQHFLEWVRSHYYLNTSQLNEHFTQQLILKSGMPENTVRSLMDTIREVHVERKTIDESDLYHLHHTIEQFYKKQGK